MANKIYTQTITNWTGGLNIEDDIQSIRPYNEKDNTAELVVCDNFDIRADGSIETSTGYEEVSTLDGETGGGIGLLAYDKTEDDRYLLICHKDKYYSVTPSDFEWSDTNLGDYGDEADQFGGVVYKGTSATARAILGTDIAANELKQADISGAMATVSNSTDVVGAYIMAEAFGRLFVAKNRTLYYTNVEDETDWAGGGNMGFNDIITGLIKEGDYLHVFTRSYHQMIKFEYDTDNIIVYPVKPTSERLYGCLAYNSLQNDASNVIYWAEEGIFQLGQEKQYYDTLPRPQSLSLKIDKLLNNINKQYRKYACSFIKKDQYQLAVPYYSNVNDRVFVFNTKFGCWTTRSGFYPNAFAKFRNSDYKEEIYFLDGNNPILYKFNDKYNYAESGYTRKIISKKHVCGDALRMKEWHYFTITGEIYSGTTATLRLHSDNNSHEFTINNEYLTGETFGDYIGKAPIGELPLGGGEVEDTSFKKFARRIKIPANIREGLSFQYEIENNGANQPIRIKQVSFDYSYKSKTDLPFKYTNSNS